VAAPFGELLAARAIAPASLGLSLAGSVAAPFLGIAASARTVAAPRLWFAVIDGHEIVSHELAVGIDGVEDNRPGGLGVGRGSRLRSKSAKR
jgi:hypothetical protein